MKHINAKYIDPYDEAYKIAEKRYKAPKYKIGDIVVYMNITDDSTDKNMIIEIKQSKIIDASYWEYITEKENKINRWQYTTEDIIENNSSNLTENDIIAKL